MLLPQPWPHCFVLTKFAVRPHRALLCLFLQLNEIHIIFFLRFFLHQKNYELKLFTRKHIQATGKRAKPVAINKRNSVRTHRESERNGNKKKKQKLQAFRQLTMFSLRKYTESKTQHSTAQHSTECVRLKVKWNGKKCEKKIQLTHIQCVSQQISYENTLIHTHRFSCFVCHRNATGTCYVPLNSIAVHAHLHANVWVREWVRI